MELITSGRADSDLNKEAKELRRTIHRTVKKVTEDIDGRFHFNTAIAAVMELINEPSDAQGTRLRSARLPAPVPASNIPV